MDRLKTFRNTVVALACTLLAFSCSNDDDSGTLPAGGYPMTFSSSVEQSLTRSSSANSWDGGEEISVRVGCCFVIKYAAAADGKLTAASGVEPFYWQRQSETKSVSAWYPYINGLPSSWAVEPDQSGTGYQQSDFLYAPATDISFSARNTARLNFYHQTAKVVINIKNEYAATNANDIVSVTIGDANNLALSGDYTTPTGIGVKVGTWTNLSDMSTVTPKDITTGTTYLKSYAALVIPQDMAGKKLIAITLSNGNTYYYTPTGTEAALAGGKQHTYDITVKNTGIIVNVGDITDWTGKTDPPTEGGAGVYKVGDYYPDPNVDLSNAVEKAKIKGVVYWLDPSDSRHGKVVGLDEKSSVKWANSYSTTNAIDIANGRANMKTIKDIDSNFSNYPVFAWVHSINDAGQTYSDANATGVWYLPARDELSALYSAYNTYGKNNFNARLTAAGGTALSDWYWSSSEDDQIKAWYVYFHLGESISYSKFVDCRARCVLAF